MFDRRMLLECRDFAAGWVPITPTWPVNYLISLVFTGIYGWLRGWESNPCRLLKTKNFTDLGFLTNRLIRSKGGVETRIEHAACDEGRARIAIQIVAFVVVVYGAILPCDEAWCSPKRAIFPDTATQAPRTTPREGSSTATSELLELGT